jgi:pimeloyl-ACP methyl ester carboxylesterase
MSEAGFSDGPWSHGHWQSADGLRLHYRDYPARADAAAKARPPLLCIPGLTRNARDFESLATNFAGEWRVIVAELRGRGDSDYAKDAATYNPAQYLGDILALFEQAGIERAVMVGTSLGGIITMLLALTAPEKIAGAVINDIGPDLEPAGMARIREYVGQGRSFATWMHAARALKESSGAAHPDFTIAEWLEHAKRLMALGGNGRISFDYDMKIAEPVHAAPAGAEMAFDLWPALRALADRPVLALRGELSDLLSEATFARMAEEVPGLELVTVPRGGHPPTLAEPVAQAGIARLLAQIA